MSETVFVFVSTVVYFHFESTDLNQLHTSEQLLQIFGEAPNLGHGAEPQQRGPSPNDVIKPELPKLDISTRKIPPLSRQPTAQPDAGDTRDVNTPQSAPHGANPSDTNPTDGRESKTTTNSPPFSHGSYQIGTHSSHKQGRTEGCETSSHNSEDSVQERQRSTRSSHSNWSQRRHHSWDHSRDRDPLYHGPSTPRRSRSHGRETQGPRRSPRMDENRSRGEH